MTGYWVGSDIQGSPEAIDRLQENSRHYFQRPDLVSATLDLSLTAPTNITTIVTAASTGTKIDHLRVQGVGTTVAGVLNVFLFDGATYHGAGARGLFDPRQDVDTDPPTLSGTSYAWNLISRTGQAVASGLYLWTVQDRATGSVERGKFLVVKSDVESFR